MERLLLIAGAATLIWCLLWVGDAVVAQRTARESLDTMLPVERPLPSAPTGEAAEAPAVSARNSTPRTGSPIALLSIPRIELSAAVLHGSDARTLRRGPGHLEYTAFPGEPGNVVIAGHRDSFFRPLQNIRLGDDIFLDTPEGRFHYEVTSLRVVDAHDLSVIAPTDERILTMITCYPFWVLGNAPDRFVVRAVAVIPGMRTLVASRPMPTERSIAVPQFDQAAVIDDEQRVREAVERFRLAYNGRAIRLPEEVRSGGLLTFEICDVDVTDDRATATCRTSPDDGDVTVRTFALRRTAPGWAIQSVELNEVK